MKAKKEELARMIDHSLLHPALTDRELEAGCRLARRYAVASVCIKPYAVSKAVRILEGSSVKTGTVVGFPHGLSAVETKVAEAVLACHEGAAEIDMVINIGKALSGDWPYIEAEMEAICAAVHEEGAILKVIFENDFLSNEEILKLCGISGRIGVDFVKTSTGYGFRKDREGHYSYRGATVEHLKLMRENTPPAVEIKAAGGIRTLDDLLLVRSLGVTRVGATATEAIIKEAEKTY